MNNFKLKINKNFTTYYLLFTTYAVRGFTFIELVMVMSIFGLLTGVVLFNFGTFSDSVSLQNLSQQIALEIKSAQSDAISGKNPNMFLPPQKPSYGLFFDANTPNKFYLFSDLNNSGDFNVNNDPVPEVESEIDISGGNTIDQICLNFGGISRTCSKSGIYITFVRPYPTSHFLTSDGQPVDSTVSSVEIVVKSAKGITTRSVFVTPLGQISVK